MRKRTKIILAISLSLLIGILTFLAWVVGLLPYSVSEALFRYRLDERAKHDAMVIPLKDMLRSDWEMVCDVHPYDGPIHVKKYGKTYDAPTRYAHDGVWVLMFLNSKGNPTFVSGGCSKGGIFLKSEVRCLEREMAVLIKERTGHCPVYKMGR